MKYSFIEVVALLSHPVLIDRQEANALTKVHPVSSGLKNIVDVLKICNYVMSSIHEVTSGNAVPFV